MPKSLSRKYVEDKYESDGGFVEDAPKSKKRKSETTRGKQNAAPSGSMEKDDEGNEFWEISGKRRVQISQFNKQTMVGIREFYEKDGKMLPGKKGISLSVDQYTALLRILPQVEKVLAKRGIDVPRPQYGDGDDEQASLGEDARDEDGKEAEEQSTSNRKLARAGSKKNHEATSEEEEGGE